MLQSMNPNAQYSTLLTPFLCSTPTPSSSERSSSDTDESPPPSFLYNFQDFNFKIPSLPISIHQTYKLLAVLSGHLGSVSCLALCGEFILSASQGKDIIVWQQPDLRQFAKFGQGEGSVKALITSGNKVFTAHQDGKVRVWRVSRSSENLFRLLETLPTTKDYLGKFMKKDNYVETRRNHKRLWIEHADSISCLAVSNGLIYSGSWDKTIKVWTTSDFKCLESIKAHNDAINGLVVSRGNVYSSSADGKIKVWGKKGKNGLHSLKGILEGKKDISLNSLVVTDDGRVVYGGGSDGLVLGWLGNKDFDSWKAVCEVKAHEMSVLCMCLMGEFLCSGSADRSICVWKREMNGGLFRYLVIKGHEGPVKCLQASPIRVGGGFMLYSGSLDKSIRVWWIPSYSDGKNDDTCSLQIVQKKSAVF